MEGGLSGMSGLLWTVELEPLKVYVPNCEPAGPDIFLSF